MARAIQKFVIRLISKTLCKGKYWEEVQCLKMPGSIDACK
jgi:hypothetical protein